MVVGERLAGHDALAGRTAVAAMGYGLYVGLAVGSIFAARNTSGRILSGAAQSQDGSSPGLVAGAAVSLLFFVALEMVPKPSAALTEWIRTRLTTRGADALLSGLSWVWGWIHGLRARLGRRFRRGVALVAGFSRGFDPFVSRSLRQGTDCRSGWLHRDRMAVGACVASEACEGLDGVWLSVGFGASGDCRNCFSHPDQDPAGRRRRGRARDRLNTAAWLFRDGGDGSVRIVAAASVVVVCTALARLGRMPLVRGVALSANYLSESFSAMLAMLLCPH